MLTDRPFPVLLQASPVSHIQGSRQTGSPAPSPTLFLVLGQLTASTRPPPVLDRIRGPHSRVHLFTAPNGAVVPIPFGLGADI